MSRDIYSISRLNREVAFLLQGQFPLIWIEGEISNLSQPRSGHLYFSLKDEHAQIRAAMFKNRNMYLGFKPKDGQQILVRAKVGLYEPRGDYQLIVEHMEEAGEGALRRAFEVLKAKLSNEGLFAAERKKTLPELPQRIGIVTSSTGAAVRDVLSVLKRRFPMIPVLIYPVAVQGKSAADDIVNTLQLAEQRNECDVLLLVRGGGSLEDLQAFNEEKLARTIVDCEIPIVTGIGHEVDFTIADFVADLRMPTPTAAAEVVSPDKNEYLEFIRSCEWRLYDALEAKIEIEQQKLNTLNRHLEILHPARKLMDKIQRLDEIESRLKSAPMHNMQLSHERIKRLITNLMYHSPRIKLLELNNQQQLLTERIKQSMLSVLAKNKQSLAKLASTLDAVSPLATLGRGYAIASHEATGKLLSDTDQVEVNDQVDLRLAKGRLKVTVDEKL